MHQYIQFEEAAQFLRNARMGGILTPDQLRAEIRHVKQRPAIGSYAVEASVPNWLVEKLDPTKRLAHNYVVFPTLDRLDTVLLATMQCANVQLRWNLTVTLDLDRQLRGDKIEAADVTQRSAAPVRGRRELSLNRSFVLVTKLIREFVDDRRLSERRRRPARRTLSGRFRHPPTFASEI